MTDVNFRLCLVKLAEVDLAYVTPCICTLYNNGNRASTTPSNTRNQAHPALTFHGEPDEAAVDVGQLAGARAQQGGQPRQPLVQHGVHARQVGGHGAPVQHQLVHATAQRQPLLAVTMGNTAHVITRCVCPSRPSVNINTFLKLFLRFKLCVDWERQYVILQSREKN